MTTLQSTAAHPLPRTRWVAAGSLALSLAGYVAAAVWWMEAMASDSSTAAIGLLFALVLAVLVTPSAVLAAVALGIARRRPAGAWRCAVVALSFHGAILLLGAAVFVPSL